MRVKGLNRLIDKEDHDRLNIKCIFPEKVNVHFLINFFFVFLNFFFEVSSFTTQIPGMETLARLLQKFTRT